MSESNRIILRAVPEVTPGTTPVNSANWITVPQNSDTLSATPNTKQSARIRGEDRLPADMTKVGEEIGGGVEYELSYGDFDVWLEAVMRDHWAIISASMSADSGSNEFRDAANGFVTAGFKAGDKIVTTNFTDAANNASWTINTVTAGVIVVKETGIIVTEAANAADINHPLQVGTDIKAFTVEKEYADITKFLALKGCQVGQLTLNFVFGEQVTGSFQLAGLTGVESGASLVGSGSVAAVSANPIIVANVDMDSITYDGSPVGTIVVKEITLNIDNNLRANNSLLSVAAVDQKAGTAQVSGKITAFASAGSWSIYTKMLGNTKTDLAWTITDGAGKGYTFSLPNIKLSGKAPPGLAENQDVMIEADFTCVVDTPQITRIP